MSALITKTECIRGDIDVNIKSRSKKNNIYKKTSMSSGDLAIRKSSKDKTLPQKCDDEGNESTFPSYHSREKDNDKKRKEKITTREDKPKLSAQKESLKSLNEVNDLLDGIDDPNEIDPKDIDLILTVRNRKQRPLADPLTDIGVDPLIPLKNRREYLDLYEKNGFSNEHLSEKSDDLFIPMKPVSSFSGVQEESLSDGRSYNQVRENIFGTSNPSWRHDEEALSCPSTYRLGIRNEVRQGYTFSRFSYQENRERPISSILNSRSLTTGLKKLGTSSKEVFSKDCRPPSQTGSSFRNGVSERPRNRYSIERNFRGILHSKISELKNEINRLNNLYNLSLAEHNKCVAYEKKVQELASELTENQYFLMELNTVVDTMMFNSADNSRGNTEVMDLKKRNEEITKAIEHIFTERKRKEEEVSKLEKKLMRDKLKNETIFSSQPKLYENNEKLKEGLRKVNHFKKDIEELNNKRQSLYEILSTSPVKLELLKLEKEIIELKRRHKVQQKKRSLIKNWDLLNNENSQIISTEKTISEINKEIKNAEEFLIINKDSGDECLKRNNNYIVLLNQEEDMDNYLSTYDYSKTNVLEKLNIHQNELLNVLNSLCKKVALETSFSSFIKSPSNDYRIVYNERKTEVENYEHLQLYSSKFEEKESKLSKDLENIKLKLEKLQEDLIEFESYNKLNRNIKEKQSSLLELKSKIKSKANFKQALHISRKLYDELREQISENNNHSELSLLETKLSRLSENHFQLSEEIEKLQIPKGLAKYNSKTLHLVTQINNFLRSNVNFS